MKKAKKLFLTLLSYGLVVALAITGTVAYLTSTDSDVNVMTLGNVQIEQLEYERVVENDAWVSTGETDKYGYTPDKVQEYNQNKPLYPAVFADGNVKWDDRNGNDHQQSWGQVGASGSNQLFDDSVRNAQDKFVFVKNTGASDAYVRTWFAFEQGSLTVAQFEELIGTNADKDHWNWEEVATEVEIEGTKFVIMTATYLGKTTNPDGKLAPNTVSYPSLLQVYMSPKATNEDCKAMDGNSNGRYDILVFSQAVQTNGFDNAKAALDEAFGTQHPWQDGVEIPETVVVENKASLNDAIADAIDGDTIVLNEDIEYTGNEYPNITKAITLDLNGNTLKTTSLGVVAKGGCSIVNGTVENPVGKRAAIRAYDVKCIENVVIDSPDNGGISVQSGDSSIEVIKNVTINSKTYGIESYRSTAEKTVGKMENVKINAGQLGIHIVGAGKFGEIKNCEIVGGTTGIQADLTGLYHIALNLVDSKVTGTANYGIDIWDEAHENTGSTVVLNYDDATVFTGGNQNVKITLGNEVTCTVNGVEQ